LKILVAKKLKRSRDEEKETVFFHNGREIRPEKLENFKKRRISKLIEVQSPSAGKSASSLDAYNCKLVLADLIRYTGEH